MKWRQPLDSIYVKHSGLETGIEPVSEFRIEGATVDDEGAHASNVSNQPCTQANEWRSSLESVSLCFSNFKSNPPMATAN